jgi:hypothetical protein
MTFIDAVPEDQATGDVAAMYETDRQLFGHLPNLTKAFSLRPDVYAAWRQLNGAIKANMDLRRYELATVGAARRLRSSRFCRPNDAGAVGSAAIALTIAGSEPLNDALTVNTLSGDDIVSASSLAATSTVLTINGGADEDILVGSAGKDTINGDIAVERVGAVAVAAVGGVVAGAAGQPVVARAARGRHRPQAEGVPRRALRAAAAPRAHARQTAPAAHRQPRHGRGAGLADADRRSGSARRTAAEKAPATERTDAAARER